MTRERKHRDHEERGGGESHRTETRRLSYWRRWMLGHVRRHERNKRFFDRCRRRLNRRLQGGRRWTGLRRLGHDWWLVMRY
jgi:hypothetical protein